MKRNRINYLMMKSTIQARQQHNLLLKHQRKQEYNTLEHLQTENVKKDEIIEQNTEQVFILTTKNKELHLEIENLRKELKEKDAEMNTKLAEDMENNKFVNRYIYNLKSEITQLNNTINDMQQKFKEKEIEMNKKLAKIKENQESLIKSIHNLKIEKNEMIKTIDNLQSQSKEKDIEMNKKLSESIKLSKTSSECIHNLEIEKNQLNVTIDSLNRDLEVKDSELKDKIEEMFEIKKSLTDELNKYKTIKEFDDIMRLNLDLVEFYVKIESVMNNCDLEMTQNDYEIEKIKLRNADLYGLVKNNENSGVKLVVKEKSGELKEAERELKLKKEIATQKFLNVNEKLTIIKEKLTECIKKFAENVQCNIGKVENELFTFKIDVNTLEETNKEINEILTYDRVKNILLQQQIAIMNEMITSIRTSDNKEEPAISKVFNDLFEKPDNIKPSNLNSSTTLQQEQQQNNLFPNFTKNVNISQQNLDENSEGNLKNGENKKIKPKNKLK